MSNKSNNLKSTTLYDEDNKTLKMVANPWNKKEHERVKRGQEEEDKLLEINKSKKK
tara:strand:- start:823 stop:990 length:168 start_codon:yes stop_codon:yes gene_type:complete